MHLVCVVLKQVFKRRNTFHIQLQYKLLDVGAKLFYHITHESFIRRLKHFQFGVYI